MMSEELKHPLAAFRESKGMSQEDLANILRVRAMTVSRWERGTAMPWPSQWEKIKLQTGVTPEQLAAFRAGKGAVAA